MLRYLKGVQMIKQIIQENDLQVMSTIARYACAYEAIAKPDWWDKSKRYCPRPITRGVILLSKAILLITNQKAVDPSSSRVPTFAICRDTLVETLTSRPSPLTPSSGTRTQATSASRQ